MAYIFHKGGNNYVVLSTAKTTTYAEYEKYFKEISYSFRFRNDSEIQSFSEPGEPFFNLFWYLLRISSSKISASISVLLSKLKIE